MALRVPAWVGASWVPVAERVPGDAELTCDVRDASVLVDHERGRVLVELLGVAAWSLPGPRAVLVVHHWHEYLLVDVSSQGGIANAPVSGVCLRRRVVQHEAPSQFTWLHESGGIRSTDPHQRQPQRV